MRLWTTQGIEIYDQLKQNGIAYCTKPLWGDNPEFMYAYRWIARQMQQRIGNPPIEGIEYPIWAWYQYDCAKKKQPPRSPNVVPEGISAYMQIEVPDNEVLLSDFDLWNAVLNQSQTDDWNKIEKIQTELEKEAGRKLEFSEYPQPLKEWIEKTWEVIFNLDRRGKGVSHKRNRSIQATLWALKTEHIISVEFLKHDGDVVKQIEYLPKPSGKG